MNKYSPKINTMKSYLIFLLLFSVIFSTHLSASVDYNTNQSVEFMPSVERGKTASKKQLRKTRFQKKRSKRNKKTIFGIDQNLQQKVGFGVYFVSMIGAIAFGVLSIFFLIAGITVFWALILGLIFLGVALIFLIIMLS